MKIIGKKIRNVDKYLFQFQEGENLYIGLQSTEMHSDKLMEYGMRGDLLGTHNFIPRPLSQVADFNANGKWIADKSLPKEKRTFESEYHIVDWHGNDHYGIRYHTRECYQRRFIQPPEVELTYINGLLISPLLVYSQENRSLIQHIINMYLEMFGECEILTEKYVPKTIVKTERLPWAVLPKGEYPWEKAKLHLDTIINTIPKRHRTIISKRHETIAENVPDFMAIGDEGFFGYVIYGFSKKGIFIFESNRPNNATYVFKGNWKEASKLTKSEILCGQLHEARIIHNQKWNDCIKELI